MNTINGKYRKKVTNVNTLFYINPEGIKISVFSPFELIINEIITLGIDPTDATISELQFKVSQICIQDRFELTNKNNPVYKITELTETKFYTKNIVIINYLKEISYWLYDYNQNKMPDNMKFDFELNRKRNAI